jgi:hypothetical protein
MQAANRAGGSKLVGVVLGGAWLYEASLRGAVGRHWGIAREMLQWRKAR